MFINVYVCVLGTIFVINEIIKTFIKLYELTGDDEVPDIDEELKNKLYN